MMTPEELRALAAKNNFNHPTAGYCDGYVQTNLVVLHQNYASDFEKFCQKNPKPCPLLEVVGPGSHKTQRLAKNADLTTMLPSYLVWRDGQIEAQVDNILDYYHDEMVFFLLGCSFSFEEALIESGIQLRHVDQKKNVSMYRTNIPLESSGPFSGKMVVSMRPIHHRQVAEAFIITGRYPDVHGEPIHVGYPEMIGIENINKVDYGDPVDVKEQEIPVFWACGVTPQNVLLQSGIPLSITHAPGYMFVCDIRNEEFAVGR